MEYEWSEIERHAADDDAWVVVDDRVYDVTQFADEHPGGREILLREKGTDATEAFREVSFHDSSRAKGLLHDQLIGVVKGGTASVDDAGPPVEATEADDAGSSAAPATSAAVNPLVLLLVLAAVSFAAYKVIIG